MYQSDERVNLYSSQVLSSLFLKEFKEGAETTAFGREFHALMTLTLKKFLRVEVLTLGFISFRLCPLVLENSSRGSRFADAVYSPVRYL